MWDIPPSVSTSHSSSFFLPSFCLLFSSTLCHYLDMLRTPHLLCIRKDFEDYRPNARKWNSLQQASRSAWTCWAKGPISMLQIFMTMNHLAGFAQPLNLVSSFLPLRHHLRKCSNPKYNLPIPSQILHDLRNYFSALFFAYVSSICSSCVSRKVLHLCHYYIRMLG